MAQPNFQHKQVYSDGRENRLGRAFPARRQRPQVSRFELPALSAPADRTCVSPPIVAVADGVSLQ
jgi:hypothetical protein